MSLKQTVENEYKNALKSKDKNKISTYRLILSSIKDLDIINRSGPSKKETDDEDIKKSYLIHHMQVKLLTLHSPMLEMLELIKKIMNLIKYGQKE